MSIGSLFNSGVLWAKQVVGMEDSCIRDELWNVEANFTVNDDGRSVAGFLRGNNGIWGKFNGILENGNVYHYNEQSGRGELIGRATYPPVSLLNVGSVAGSFVGMGVFLVTGGYYGGVRRKYNDDRQGCCPVRRDVGWISPAALGFLGLSVAVGSAAFYGQHHIPAANNSKDREDVEWLKWGIDIALKAAWGLLAASVVASAAELELRVKRLCCRKDLYTRMDHHQSSSSGPLPQSTLYSPEVVEVDNHVGVIV